MHQNTTIVTQAEPRRPHRVRPTCVRRADAPGFRRWVVRSAVEARWLPWAEFVGRAHLNLAPGRKADDTLNAWAVTRERVLSELAALGLTGIVVRTDDAPELGEHEADLAGLVRLYPEDGELAPELVPLPARVWRSRNVHDQHALRMLTEHGLIAADERIPVRPRAFCGQRALSDHGAGPAYDSIPHWWGHAHAWTDSADQPVLTVEPYNYNDDPARLLADVTRWLADEQLPLVADGPHPGVWHDSTTLVALRYDFEHVPLPAEHAVWVPFEYPGPCRAPSGAPAGAWELA